jgi:5'-deoxynucleotidase YfbR-like HD superfamily hydrolase
MAIAHDMPEMELNDCPHIIKVKYPQIKHAFEICEAEVVKLLPKSVRDGVMEFDEGKTTAAKFVILADAIQCKQFSEVEVGLGNVGYMKVVLDNSNRRIAILTEELKKYERD